MNHLIWRFWRFRPMGGTRILTKLICCRWRLRDEWLRLTIRTAQHPWNIHEQLSHLSRFGTQRCETGSCIPAGVIQVSLGKQGTCIVANVPNRDCWLAPGVQPSSTLDWVKRGYTMSLKTLAIVATLLCSTALTTASFASGNNGNNNGGNTQYGGNGNGNNGCGNGNSGPSGSGC
jgi:hypothetical protein